MTTKSLAAHLSALLSAREHALATNADNGDRANVFADEIRELVEEHMPRGSGIDAGTSLDFAKSTPEKLVFDTSFHHMNEVGYYDGWTEHVVTVRPTFDSGFDLTISGRNRNQIKDYLHDVFTAALRAEDTQYGWGWPYPAKVETEADRQHDVAMGKLADVLAEQDEAGERHDMVADVLRRGTEEDL